MLTLAGNSNHDRDLAKLNVLHFFLEVPRSYLTDFQLVSVLCSPSSIDRVLRVPGKFLQLISRGLSNKVCAQQNVQATKFIQFIITKFIQKM